VVVTIDDKNEKTRTVRYHQHGVLRKIFNYKTHIQSWVFEGPHNTKGIMAMN